MNSPAITAQSKVHVYITIDTEASIAGAFADPQYKTPQLELPVFGYVDKQSHGLGFILDTLKNTEQVATFFTESLQSRYFGHEPMAKVAQLIVEHGQDLQLHVHPCWTNFTDSMMMSRKENDHSTGRSVAELSDIFSDAMQRFNQFGCNEAVAVRTGNFSTGIDTFQAFNNVGIKASSNIAVDIAPPIEPSLHLSNGLHNVEGIIELPLTTFASYSPVGAPRKRSMAVTACSFSEMSTVLEQAYQQGLDSVCILTHPFEFFRHNQSKISANKLNQQRFMQLCSYLQANSDKFVTSTFAQLATRDIAQLSAPSVQLQGSYHQALVRAGQNFIGDKIGF